MTSIVTVSQESEMNDYTKLKKEVASNLSEIKNMETMINKCKKTTRDTSWIWNKLDVFKMQLKAMSKQMDDAGSRNMETSNEMTELQKAVSKLMDCNLNSLLHVKNDIVKGAANLKEQTNLQNSFEERRKKLFEDVVVNFQNNRDMIEDFDWFLVKSSHHHERMKRMMAKNMDWLEKMKCGSEECEERKDNIHICWNLVLDMKAKLADLAPFKEMVSTDFVSQENDVVLHNLNELQLHNNSLNLIYDLWGARAERRLERISQQMIMSEDELSKIIMKQGKRMTMQSVQSQVMNKSFKQLDILRQLKMNSYFITAKPGSRALDLNVGVHHCVACQMDGTVSAIVVCVKDNVKFDAEICYYNWSGTIATPDRIREKVQNNALVDFWMMPIAENNVPYREIIPDLKEENLMNQLTTDGKASVLAHRVWRQRLASTKYLTSNMGTE